MRADLLRRAAELATNGVPFVLAIVTSRRPASSAQPGDMALVTADGEFEGWLGGACTRPTVVREAQAALADGQPRLLALAPDPEEIQRPGLSTFPMTCHSGGTVEIYLEPVLPAPRLVLFGVSPAARALAKLGQAMGYAITAVGAEADATAFPGVSDLRPELGPGDLEPSSAARPVHAVVATMGEGDEEAIEAALAIAPAYVGVVASARRFAALRETLLARGIADAALARVKSPAGLDLGARTPEEIALAVLAEIVQLRRAAERGQAPETGTVSLGTSPAPHATDAPVAHGAPSHVHGPVAAGHAPPPAVPGPSTAPATAIDPICGMTVNVAKARHTADHLGTTYYFCCAGCRDRFAADPTRFVNAESPA